MFKKDFVYLWFKWVIIQGNSFLPYHCRLHDCLYYDGEFQVICIPSCMVYSSIYIYVYIRIYVYIFTLTQIYLYICNAYVYFIPNAYNLLFSKWIIGGLLDRQFWRNIFVYKHIVLLCLDIKDTEELLIMATRMWKISSYKNFYLISFHESGNII